MIVRRCTVEEDRSGHITGASVSIAPCHAPQLVAVTGAVRQYFEIERLDTS